MALRPDLAIIAGAVPAATRVLDVGCGDGDLIAALRDKGVDARGLEIDATNVTAAIARVHTPLEPEIEDGPTGPPEEQIPAPETDTPER